MTSTSNTAPIKIMIVDDSAVIRGFLGKLIEGDEDMEVTSTAGNGQVAVERLKQEKYDVILLDVQMPVIDGLTAIPLLLQIQPNVKIIMCSTLTSENAETTLNALALGAVECIAKPSSTQDMYSTDTFRNVLLHTIRGIAGIKKLPPIATSPASASQSASQPDTPLQRERTLPPREQNTREQNTQEATKYNSFSRAGKTVQLLPPDKGYNGKPDLLAIGSSTGGPNALFKVIPYLKGIEIPVVITQHMPPTFTRILAEHIEQQTGIKAVEGEEGMPLLAGRVHVAPGGYHMLFKKNGPSTVITLDNGPMENFCRPAVDPMLRSAIKIYGQKIMAVILTGMGQDGMMGAREVVAAGGRVIAQDEATSVVWGMPGAAALDGSCSAVLPLEEIGPWLKKSSLRLH